MRVLVFVLGLASFAFAHSDANANANANASADPEAGVAPTVHAPKNVSSSGPDKRALEERDSMADLLQELAESTHVAPDIIRALIPPSVPMQNDDDWYFTVNDAKRAWHHPIDGELDGETASTSRGPRELQMQPLSMALMLSPSMGLTFDINELLLLASVNLNICVQRWSTPEISNMVPGKLNATVAQFTDWFSSMAAVLSMTQNSPINLHPLQSLVHRLILDYFGAPKANALHACTQAASAMIQFATQLDTKLDPLVIFGSTKEPRINNWLSMFVPDIKRAFLVKLYTQ